MSSLGELSVRCMPFVKMPAMPSAPTLRMPIAKTVSSSEKPDSVRVQVQVRMSDPVPCGAEPAVTANTASGAEDRHRANRLGLARNRQKDRAVQRIAVAVDERAVGAEHHRLRDAERDSGAVAERV